MMKCEGGEWHGQYELEDLEGKTKENLQTYKHTRKAPELAWGLMFTPSP